MSSFDFGDEITEKVEIIGDFHVTIQEKKTESNKVGTLLTFHDIGLDHTSFKEFFRNEYNLQFYDKFVVYHIDAPGQHKGAEKLSSDYQYPALSKMGEMLGPVLEHFQLKDVVGLGVGAGANVLIHTAMLFPDKFLGITVVDPASKSVGFKEWSEEILATYQLERKGFTSSAEKFLIWHLFGTKGKKKVNMEMVDQYIKDITANQNPHNLAQYVKAYMHRSDFLNGVHEKLKYWWDRHWNLSYKRGSFYWIIRCSILIITSSYSPYKEEAYSFHSKLSREKSSIIESFESVNAFFEDPGKCGEGMLLLMQGCGLVPTLRTRTASRGGPVHRTASMSED